MSQANKWEWVKDESYCCSLRSGTGRTVMEPMSYAGETWISVLPEDAKKIETAPELLDALRMALDWIDAVPNDVQLPTMPGFDRDYVDSLIGRAQG